MSRRLVLFIDGTWQKSRSHTNVERLCQLVADSDNRGIQQIPKYHPGVGVAPGVKHWLGGIFGLGLSDEVKFGFRWLSKRWGPGDEIWLFGFSRGAYAVRSLAGMIRKCGLLKPDDGVKVTHASVKAAYALYRNNLHPDDPQMVAFRANHSREVLIRFIGVWETVGDLGIPGVAAWFPYSRKRYAFHDTRLSRIVQYACQALALDEHRAAFKPTKWTRSAAGPELKPGQIEIEQRWFVGAHGDVGGCEPTDGAGHSPNTLPEIPLAWMQAKARGAGLAFKTDFTPQTGAELDVPNPTWKTFLKGLYKLFSKRYQRVLGGGINETIDPTVWLKWYEQANYRPVSISTAMQAGRIELGSSGVK